MPGAAAAAHAPHRYENPKLIQAGIGYNEMIRRFGKPSLKITRGAGRSTLTYSERNRHFQVEVEDGQVIAVAEVKSGQDALVLPPK